MPYNYNSDQDLDPDNTMLLVDVPRKAYFRRHIVVRPLFDEDPKVNTMFDKAKSEATSGNAMYNMINMSIMPWTKICTKIVQ